MAAFGRGLRLRLEPFFRASIWRGEKKVPGATGGVIFIQFRCTIRYHYSVFSVGIFQNLGRVEVPAEAMLSKYAAVEDGVYVQKVKGVPLSLYDMV